MTSENFKEETVLNGSGILEARRRDIRDAQPLDIQTTGGVIAKDSEDCSSSSGECAPDKLP